MANRFRQRTPNNKAHRVNLKAHMHQHHRPHTHPTASRLSSPHLDRNTLCHMGIIRWLMLLPLGSLRLWHTLPRVLHRPLHQWHLASLNGSHARSATTRSAISPRGPTVSYAPLHICMMGEYL